MSYKYTTTFESEIFAHQVNDDFVSKASLNELASLVPNEIDFEKNVDLLGVSFNAAVVNVFNRNGDGIDTATALKYNNQFIHKPTNIEHNKSNIVGHIVTAGFSEYGSNKILSNEDLENKKDPFNIALGAVVYKSANKEFAKLIERSADPEDESYYKKISASWEVGFSDYVLAVGSDKLNEATIVSDPHKIKEMNGFLKAYGGSGKTDKGEPIYRLISGKIYPLGIGFTSNPAADVKGVYKDQQNDDKDKFSQKDKKTVKKENNIAMENIVNELKEILIEKKIGEETVASMTHSFSEAIRQKNEEFLKEKEALMSEQEAVKKEYEDLKASVTELENKLGEASERISAFENEKKAEEAVARFNSRMDELDSKFDLADEDREFLAKEVKSLDETEEAYASFSGKLEMLWKHKNKANKEAFETEIQARIDEEVAKRISTASAEVSVEDALDKVKQVDADISNNNEALASKEEGLVNKFKKAFSRENIEIS